MKHRRDPRRSDSGTIAVVTAILLPVMFAMAALAVDAGFLYTRSRMIYAVADSAVFVGMKDLVAGASSSTITADVADIAAKYGGAYTITATPTSGQVQVTVTATYKMFFATALGFPSKSVTVVAIGKQNPSPPPILALGSGCGSGGVTINGQGAMTVNGNVESMGPLIFGTGPPGPIINGSALSECGPTPSSKNTWDTVSGTYGTGGPFSDPFTPYTLPTCDYGSTTTAYSIPGSGPPWDTTTTPPTLHAGVYCSSGNLLVTGPGTGFTATGVTLISVGGTISLNAS
ncbi:MAG TPA: TadE/TadG family type IV pilus assembly protein, partial [Polyangia bacterium]|nr:TadE/TadG family type IV pilus assembly protein [Polyangia bacterium]